MRYERSEQVGPDSAGEPQHRDYHSNRKSSGAVQSGVVNWWQLHRDMGRLE